MRFKPNPGNDVAGPLVQFIELTAEKGAAELGSAQDYVRMTSTSRWLHEVHIMFPEQFENWPEVLWFVVDEINGEPRILVECFERESDAIVDLGWME